MIVCCARYADPTPELHRMLETHHIHLPSVDHGGDVVGAYQEMYLAMKQANQNFFAYVHDDVTIHAEKWHRYVVAEFADPQVAIVGLGGAIGIGVEDIYKRRYNITQLQRIGYFSNQTDAEVHGQRFEGAMDVAVVDGFFMAVRRSFLDQIGGWQWMRPHVRFHCYDTALCLRAIREGYKVRMVGVSCTHHGGGHSTKEAYRQWCLEHNTTVEREHSEPHKWFYEYFRSLLPYRV